MKTLNRNPVARAILAACCLSALPAVGAQLWVSPNGDDANAGTQTHPLASLERAQQKAYEFRQTKTNSGAIEIILREGTYTLLQTLQLRPEVSGSEKKPTIIRAASHETPVLSGALEIRGWKSAGKISGLAKNAEGKVWAAEIPKLNGHLLECRQLWVNDAKAVRAREPNGDSLAHLVAWDKTHQTALVPAASLKGATNPGSLEMIVDQVWEIAILRVKAIEVQSTNARISFQQPESRLEFQHPWPPVIVNDHYRAPFFFANAIQFLDSPGEWFEDLSAGKIYYWPRPGEDLKRAHVLAPVAETLVNLEGSLDAPLANIQFQGITFSHTTWLRPSHQGHVPLQAGMFLLDAKKLSPKGTPYHRGLDNLAWIGRPPAAVTIKNARNITFTNCTFEHLASAGLDFQSGTRDDTVSGCIFRDVGGNGFQLGKFSDTNVETHIPYQPSDEREVCAHETISDNVFTDCANEDWGCVGIGIGYARDVSIQHNEVSDLPYTGISVGWGWTKATNCLSDNLIFANYIHHVGQRLGDLGGIYTLSAQPGTVIAENAISDMQPSPYVPDPDHWYYLYLDEGSSFITVRDNWCPAEKFLKNANGPGNVWTNNGPQVSEKIKIAAGLEPVFRHLLNSSSNP